MKYGYPILNKVFDFYHGKNHINLNSYKLYACQHLLGPQLEMFKFLVRFGFLPENIFVIGKAYSSNIEIFKEVKDLGINVEQPVFTEGSFQRQHVDNCNNLINKISGTHNIILDDGAQIIDLSDSKNILFAVEQTSSGFRKLEHKTIKFPVVNVARSKTKLIQESPFIARLAIDRVKEYLYVNKIDKPKFLIVGLGPIGEAVRLRLGSEFSVLGVDRLETGLLTSFILDNQIDIVIGAAGARILEKKDIERLEGSKKISLISVASSDIEFPVEHFRRNEKLHDDVYFGNVVFVNNGFPITFKGNRNEGTPQEIEKTIALLMGSVLSNIIEPEKTVGLLDVKKDLEDLINSV